METCKMNKDYLISIDYPYYIKRKSDDKIMRFRYRSGNIVIDFTIPKFHHQIMANQFISNPNILKQVDHIDHDGTNNG